MAADAIENATVNCTTIKDFRPSLAWLCLSITLLWLAEELDFMPFPRHLHGRWSFRANQTWGKWMVCLTVYHDSPAPNVGPALNPDRSYTLEA